MGWFNKLYTTNLSYISSEIRKQAWLRESDCSKMIANIISNINLGKSLEKYYKPDKLVFSKVKRIRNMK